MTTDPRRHTRQVALFRKLALAFAIFLVVVLIAWSDPQARFTSVLSELTEDAQNGIQITDPTLRGTQANGQAYTIRATAMRQTSRPAGTLEMDKPQFEFADPQGPLTARAQAGSLDQTSNQAVLRGAVEIRDAAGNIIRAPVLTFNTKTGDFTAQGQVRMDSPSGTLLASALKSTAKIHVFSNAEMTLLPKEAR